MDDRTRSLLADAQSTAREQLSAAIERIFDERQAGLSQKLNQAVRRLRSCESDAQWANALVDATQGFCDRAILFHVAGRSLRIQAARNAGAAHFADAAALDSALALASAVETKDTVVALRTRGEMSEPVAAWLGEVPHRKFHAIPVITREGAVAGVLYADGDQNPVDAGALELLATVAGAVHEKRGVFIEIQPAPAKALGEPWLLLSREDQDLHMRAQRFARVHIAQMRLYKSDEVKIARTERNLYASLRVEFDSAREVFQRDFLSATDTMVDYLHLETLKTLANDDAALLGDDYPGPLDEVHV
jgi:hypothetical protein